MKKKNLKGRPVARFLRGLARPGLLALALGAANPTQAQLLPEIMFKDTFNVSETSFDLDFERATRQSGMKAPLSYIRSGAETAVVLSPEGAEDQLTISNAYISPDYNFKDGGQFSIEFDVNPGIDDDPSDGLSGDWCAVVFGASTQNVFVNASDGFGILFRNDGRIEVWDGGAVSYSGISDPVAPPTDAAFHVKIDVTTADFKGSPATIRMFINGTQVRLANDSLERVKAAGFRNNFVTFEGLGTWTHAFDNISISSVPCATVSPIFVDRLAGQASDAITVGIPAQLNTGKEATLMVTSSNPEVAVPAGADSTGKLSLVFAANGALTKTFTVNALKAGSAIMQITGPNGLCVNEVVKVNVASGTGLSEVVFSDDFDTSEGSWDVNFENDQRQTGTAGILGYTEAAASAAGGVADDFTQVNGADAPGQLMIMNQNAGVSPDHNFIEGPEFKIEFEVTPGVNLPDRSSDNWAAVVFGATSRNLFVNASDGIGILFRNNGAIQVFDGGSAVYTSAPGLLPEGALNVRIEAKTSDFHGGGPATVRMFINDQPFQITPAGNELVKASGFRANYITLLGYGESLVHAFDDFKVTALAGIHALSNSITFAPDETSQQLTIQIPAAMNTGKAATVKLTSNNPGVAIPEGAVNGVLTLTFPAGGPITQTINILPVGKGRATFELSNTEGVLVGDAIVVTVPSAFVRNPSFEANYNPTFPSYSDITGWDKVGGTGVNRSGGPFHDNGVIPDGDQVAFLQGNASISQTINGLTAGKKYWLQLRYNSRGCCGGAVPDLTVRFDGADVEAITGIAPVGGANEYYTRNFVFVAPGTSGLLELAGSAAGDATTLLDAITIVQRDDGNVVVTNPSFEASGEVPAPGVMTPKKISGWTGTGTYGVNFSGAGAFANNGTNPDQDMVAFIQGVGSLSQRIGGLVSGEVYTVSYSYNARTGNQPHLKVTAGENVLQDEDVSPVGGVANYQVKTATFTANDSFTTLTFAQTKEGDQTVLIDNVTVKGKAVVLPPIKVSPTTFDLNIVQRGSTVTVTIPAELTANNAATITVTSQNPAVAIPAGAVNGSLDLVFPVGGVTEKTFEVLPVGIGSTRFTLSNRLGAQFENDAVSVAVSGSFVRNPSFEANSHPTFPGYGPINGWTGTGSGNTGLNNAGGPFHDNGLIPDRNQVALLQAEKTISQTILGLVPGRKYWLQFYYNTRNCCGGTTDLTVRFGGVDIATIPALTPVGGVNPYNFHQVEFTPTETSGDLEFSAVAVGDATALLDSISIVQRDEGSIVIQNPSFEASGVVAFPGYVNPRSIAGWTGTGNYGVNVSGAGPFADNGKNSDQDAVAFIQDKDASIKQTVSGLTVGQQYTLSYAYNARGGNAPHIKVTIGGQTAQDEDVTPVGGSNAYRVRQFGFTAEADTVELVFTQTATGDHTLLIDDVEIVPGGVAPEVRVGIERANNTVKIRWSASATGYVLQSSPNVASGWTNVALPETVEGNDKVVTDSLAGSAKFYRLVKP